MNLVPSELKDFLLHNDLADFFQGLTYGLRPHGDGIRRPYRISSQAFELGLQVAHAWLAGVVVDEQEPSVAELIKVIRNNIEDLRVQKEK